jgi:CPA2 family monovalent cation:H+ antiporter-2
LKEVRGYLVDNVILEIGLALGLIAFVIALANKLGLSNIPFLILIGIAVGPHAPQFGPFDFRFIESASLISFMGRVGVLFLLFYLGLEANLTRLIEAGRSILVGGTIYVSINFTLGFTLGYLAGFPLREALIIAGLTTVSSSAIVAKILFDYRRMANAETQVILGITMFEDIFLAVYLSLISGIVLSGATSFAGVLSSGGIALAFIVGLMLLGRWATPLLNRALSISSNELFVVVIFGCLFLLAGLGETIHVAESIGALLLGLILGETEHSDRMERLVVPFRDFFGAIFFFSFGLSIDPFTLGGAVWLAIGAALLSIIGVIIAGSIVGWRGNLSTVGSLNTSFTLLARGEFSIIIVNLAIAGGLMSVLQPFAALYVLILASASPLLAKESERIHDLFMRLLNRLRRTSEP